MRTTFALAVLAATVFSTPLAPASSLEASAGALAQIEAHSFAIGDTPATSELPSHIQMMSQTDAELDALASMFGTGEKAAGLYDALEALQDHIEHEIDDEEVPLSHKARWLKKEAMHQKFEAVNDMLNKYNTKTILGFDKGKKRVLTTEELKWQKFKVEDAMSYHELLELVGELISKETRHLLPEYLYFKKDGYSRGQKLEDEDKKDVVLKVTRIVKHEKAIEQARPTHVFEQTIHLWEQVRDYEIEKAEEIYVAQKEKTDEFQALENRNQDSRDLVVKAEREYAKKTLEFVKEEQKEIFELRKAAAEKRLALNRRMVYSREQTFEDAEIDEELQIGLKKIAELYAGDVLWMIRKARNNMAKELCHVLDRNQPVRIRIDEMRDLREKLADAKKTCFMTKNGWSERPQYEERQEDCDEKGGEFCEVDYLKM